MSRCLDERDQTNTGRGLEHEPHLGRYLAQRDSIEPGSSSVLDDVRRLVEPFAAGAYVKDWAARAGAISALSDFCGYAARESGHWDPESVAVDSHPLSLTPTRKAVLAASRPWSRGGDGVSLNFDFGELVGPSRDVVAAATAGLDGAEKIVISATAHSLSVLANPPELVLELMNLLYEEALHLEAVGRLVGLDHSQVEWIPEERRTNWELVKSCKTPMEYMLVEHCLYEGRGTIASAAGAFHLERSGVPRSVVDAFTAISEQEANHNISGFRWLKLLDTGTQAHERAVAAAVRMFLDAEALPDPDGSARSLRKHFPLYLIHQYRTWSDFYHVKREIVSASRAARSTGRPHVPAEHLYAASSEAARWCRTS